jgi:asparagine synthase (glutamine-hydrolysing)
MATGVPGERAQPASLDQVIWITADICLNDRAALVAVLRSHGREVHIETGDAALVLHAYMVWGIECVEHISGDFAFALWDSPRQRLVLACDPLGVVPLYYVRTATSLIAANCMTSLRALPDVSDAIDESTLVDYFLCGRAADMDATFYRDIRRLPPAHLMVWNVGSEPQIRRYWQLPEFDGYLRLPKAADYVEQFRDLLRTAVRDRLPADRVAFTLTGGLDSGSVVALSADICRQEGRNTVLQAYSIGHDWLIPDTECYYAFLTAKATGVPSEYVSVEQWLEHTRRDDGGVGWCAIPEPRLGSSRPSSFTALYQRASATGTRVLLSGLGGDALLEAESVKWGPLMRSGQLGTAFRGLATYRTECKRLPLRLVRRLLLPSRSARFTPPSLDLLASTLAKSPLVSARIDRIRTIRENYRSGRHRLLYDGFWSSAMSLGEPEFTGVPIRIRHPFLDTRLLTFACSIAPMPWFADKFLLREAMHGLLPEPIRRRPKTLLGSSALLALMQHGLYQGADALLSTQRIGNFIDGDSVHRCLTEVHPAMSRTKLSQLEYALTVCHWLEICSTQRQQQLPRREEKPVYVA